MSDSVVVLTKVTDLKGLERACQAEKLPAPVLGRHKLYDGTYEGHAVRFPDWQFPAVFNLAKGETTYDTYRGQWGEQHHMDKFLSRYEAEVFKMTAESEGRTCVEEIVDGRIEVLVSVGGGTAEIGGGGLGSSAIN